MAGVFVEVGSPVSGDLDPRLAAGVALLGRCGARDLQIRFSDDELPVVWFAVASFERDGLEVHETAAAMEPVMAVLRLCESVIDGGRCVHCERPSGFEPDHATPTDTPLAHLICWYQWDPELVTFRRGCEGDQP